MLRRYFVAFLAPFLLVGASSAAPPVTGKAKPVPAKVAPAKPAAPPVVVGLPQDALPHDSRALIEWWYWNAFLTTEKGHHYAVVCSFFRTGLSAAKKGHYLIYSLADLDEGTRTAYSILDKTNVDLLRSYLPLVAMQHPDDPRPLQLLAQLKGGLPAPHRALGEAALVKTAPRFSIAFDNNTLSQEDDVARTWQSNLTGDDWTLDMNLSQPVAPDAPPMLVGGKGKTGLTRPDDMYYLSLTRMAATGTLTIGGVVEKVTGAGWLDRQWGTSWVAGDNGWDWWGMHLSDGSDLIIYRVKDNKTGRILRSEATLLARDGTQTVEPAPVFTPGTTWTDEKSGAVFPLAWTLRLPKSDLTLTVKASFADQTIPVIGIGDVIWEGAVEATGTGKGGAALTGRGYMELVGYRKPAPAVAKGGGAK